MEELNITPLILSYGTYISLEDYNKAIDFKNKEYHDMVAKFREEEKRNKLILKYLEKYFSEREYYEFAQLVRETKEANIEWLKEGVK